MAEAEAAGACRGGSGLEARQCTAQGCDGAGGAVEKSGGAERWSGAYSAGGDSGEGSLPLLFETHANLQRLRVRNAVNSQVGFSGTHRREAFPSGSYSTAASEPCE
ncbi:hypothetical protein U1Q18_017749 [Sarracenia purpurea var. burkii]